MSDMVPLGPVTLIFITRANRQMDGWMDGWMDRQTDRQEDGWMKGCWILGYVTSFAGQQVYMLANFFQNRNCMKTSENLWTVSKFILLFSLKYSHIKYPMQHTLGKILASAISLISRCLVNIYDIMRNEQITLCW